MSKVYVIAGGFSGEDYRNDEPEVFGIYETREHARKELKRSNQRLRAR